MVSTITYVFMGLVIIYFGYPYEKGSDNIKLILGVGFVIYGIGSYIYNSRYIKNIITKYKK